MNITDTATIAEVAAEFPATVRVFQRYGIDFCCGGKRPLRSACEQHHLSFEELASELTAASLAPAGAARDWTREPLAALIAGIVTTYHEPLRDELPRLAAMAAKVARVHGIKSAALSRINDAVRELATDLDQHMREEELVLFPGILAAATAPGSRAPLASTAARLEHEHEAAGALLAELRELTGGYVTPTWGCGTVRALFDGLHELETSMHLHVHLENNVLFPRALRIDDPAVQ
jgi:regulator of cell morphogenesis and NO signaling